MTVLSEEQKLKVEELAGLFFSPEDIAIVMQLDLQEFNGPRFEMEDFDIPFKRGKLLKEAEFRTKVFALASAGSSAAQIIAKEIIDKSKLYSISI